MTVATDLEPTAEACATAPLGLLAELTHRCPLRCPYCSNPIELVRRSAELTTQQWQDVFTQAAELGVLQVHLSGGEPTARTDLEAIIAHAADHGLYTNLITAAVLLSRERLEALAEAGLDHVQISFQDAEAGNADRIGGHAGGHAKKLAVARWVRELDLPLTVNAPVHRQNLDHLEDIIALAVELGAERLEVAHVQYYGWGLRNRAALMPTLEQVKRSAEAAARAQERLKGVLAIDFVAPDYHAKRPKPCMGGWGRQFMTVTPSGKVLPCHAAETIPGLRFDNVVDRPLRDIWLNGESFAAFRGTDWMSEPCASCEYRDVDWGGCRCQALALTGRADNTDPVCWKSPLHGQVQALAARETSLAPAEFAYRRY